MNRKYLLLAAVLLPVMTGLQGCARTSDSQTEEPAMTSETTDTGGAVMSHKVVLTAEVGDIAMWEQKFRTHGEMFRSQGTNSPILIGSTDGNRVAIYEETTDLDGFLASLESPETIAAMEEDGVLRDTVRVFVLDREFSF